MKEKSKRSITGMKRNNDYIETETDNSNIKPDLHEIKRNLNLKSN
jgi:hypothetical protein